MNDTPQDDGLPTVAGEIDELPREIAPPAELEERVVRALSHRGLIETGGPATAWHRIQRGALAAAASVALIAVGFVAGRASGGPAPIRPDGAIAPQPGVGPEGTAREPGVGFVGEQRLFSLMLYEDDAFQTAPAGALGRYREYSEWIATVARDGHFIDGEALDEAGWVLSRSGDDTAVEQGFGAPTDAVLSGFFLVAADTAAEAIAIASEIPHLRYGGRVVVRPILPTDTPPER